LRYGVDFSGGTLVYVKFKENPQLDAIRGALKQRGLGESTIQRFGAESDREVIISLDQTLYRQVAVSWTMASPALPIRSI
jgi:preprotein translocase subunit SecF